MPPDEDGEGHGQGLAMLRLEARRYKREMQQIWMQRELHEQKKSTASFSSEDSSRIHDDRWRFSDTFTTSPATSGTPMFWNREDVAVSRLEQLAIVEEGTQTDNPSKSEVQTETEKLQYDDDLILCMRESNTVSSATKNVPVLKTCSRHCDELRSRISQEAACECIADAAVRVNADVVFTAKPKRIAVEGQVETPDFNYSSVFRPDEKGTVLQTSTIATSPTGSLNKGQKSTDSVRYCRPGLRSLVSPVPQHDSACSPIHNLHDDGARFRRLRDTSKGTTLTELFSWQQDRSEPERSSSIPPTFSTQVSTPQPEASCGGTKAGDNTSDFSTEISGSKRVRNELTGESAMAARLATRIKHALEAIGGKADTRSTKSTFNPPGRAIQSLSACRLRHKDECSEIKLFEDADETCGGRSLDNKETASSDSSLPKTCQHARKVPMGSSQNHSSSIPGSDADMYFQNVMAALSTDRYTSNKLSGSCTAREVSPARAARRAERRAEAARRANIKSCGDHLGSHQADGIKNSVKNDVRQSGSKHVREKQRLLSNVQKLQNVAKTAKRLYTDLVDCAYDELRASTDCGNLVNHQDEDGAGDISKFARPINEFCPSTEETSLNRRGVAFTGNDEVCGRCHVCQPQFISRENHQACMEDTARSTCRDSWPCGIEQPPEEAQTDSLDEITIELSDASPTSIMVSKNDCTERPGYKVEISTPYESPCQRECSPNNRGENIVRRGTASWKDSCRPATCRTGTIQQVKKFSNKCLLDPRCVGPGDGCHMPTSRAKCSRPSTVCISQAPKKDSNKCLLDPCCDGPRDSCHMPTRSKCSGASTVCISQAPKKDSNKCCLDPCSAGPRNSCHMLTRAKCSGANTVCISQPKKDSNMCQLDPCCVGSRDSCHMPTYAKSSRVSCGPGGSSRLNRNNGTKLENKDPSVLSRCPVHRRRGMESGKGKLENNSCRGKFRSAGKDHRKILHDEIPVHTLLHERKQKSPGRLCRDMSKCPKSRLDENSKVGPLSESRDLRDLCMIHNVVRSSSMKGKENETANGGHEETAGLHHSSSGRMDLNNPEKNVHRSFQECSRIGGVRNHSTLTATEVIEKEHAFVGKETRQPPVRHMTGNASALSEAYTQTTQPHEPQLDHVDRAAAAAGLAEEIEVMIADQLGKSNRRIRESNYLMSRRKLPEVPNDSYGQTKLDVAITAAKKLKSVSLLPVVKQDEGNQKTTPRKGPRSRAKMMAEDAIGSSFYDQMHKELEELASKRMQLVRQEWAQFQSQSSLFPRQEHDRHAGFSIKGRSVSDLKNLANAGSELEESRRSVRIRRNEEFSNFWDEPIGSHTPGSKRQRSTTSPAREHSNKLLRLSVGNAESQAGRKKQDEHPTLSASINQGVRKSNKGLDRVRPVNFEPWSTERSRRKGKYVSEVGVEKLNGTSSAHLGLDSANRMSSSSFGRWKPPPEESQAKITTKRKIFTTRKIRPPAWVERMSKAKDVFTSLLRPVLLAHSRKEPQLKPTFRRRTLRPPGLMFRSSVTSKQFGKRIPGGRALQPNPPRIQSKKPVPSVQYDIHTGRKIVYSEREPGELLHTRVENWHILSNFKPLHEKNITVTRRPIVMHGRMPSAVTNSGRYHVRIRGWNADPLIRSDIPHKPADIMRYNRNGGLDVQVRRRDAGGKNKMFTGISVRQKNVRQVTFAGMVVHNSRNESSRKGLIGPKSSDSLQSKVANKKASASQPRRAESAIRKRRSSSATKMQPMRGWDKGHRYGAGGGQWTYHEGFWTERFKSELEKVSRDDSLQSQMTSGSMSQLGTPILEWRSAQVIENDTLSKPAERIGAEGMLTIEPSVLVKSMHDEDVTGIAGGKISRVENAQSSGTNVELWNGSDVQRSGVFTEGDGKSQNPDLFKSLGFLESEGLEVGAIIDHSSVVSPKGFLCPSRSNEEPCSEMELTIMPKMQAQVSKINCPNQHDGQERRRRELSPDQFPRSPLRLLDKVFPDSTENEALVSMFDRLQESTSIHIEAQSVEQRPASESITRQTVLDTLAHENEEKLKKIQLERTLMDIVLHTILQDDPLQDQEVFASRIEPISLPTNRRVAIRADKEVEAVVHSHDMSQSPLSKAIPRVDSSTEHDIVPHVDRATELDNSSLFSKDQDSQTTDVEHLVPNIQRLTSPTQDRCSAKLQRTQVHHQATECQVPWNTVGIQTPDTTATISTPSLSPQVAMPVLMPVFFHQLGTSVLPTVLPAVHFELPVRITTSSDVHPPPVCVVSCSFPAAVNQGTQATESHIQLSPKETSTQVHHQVSKLPINSRAPLGQLGVWEEESDSDWEELMGGSSPSTPSTPLSSPGHKTSLKKAMELYPVNSSSIGETTFKRKDPQPSISEACQTLVSELAPPIQMMTETIIEDIVADEPPQTTSANETRRGTTWAKVKEMEAAALALLRAASMKMSSATSSSEYSRETSPEFHNWMSPGEVNIEEVGRSSTDSRFLKNVCNTRTFQEHFGIRTQSHAWNSFGSGRASIGEIYNPACFLGLLSEGEVEAGVVSSLDEPGQVQTGFNFASHSRTDLEGQGSEPGEFHVDADASSPQRSPTSQVVS